MSFRPLQEGSISSALLGAADPAKFVDVAREDIDKSLFDREIHSPEEKQSNIRYTLIIIVISAIIFVTVISIYDVFRSIITNYFARQALTDPSSHNKKEEIESTIVANQDALRSNIVFSIFCIITGVILIYILLKFI